VRLEGIAAIGAVFVILVVSGLESARAQPAAPPQLDPPSRVAAPVSAIQVEPVRVALRIAEPPKESSRDLSPEVIRIALQAGHWRADEAPQELSGLRGNGTSWRGVPEWETNLAIARSAGAMLEARGYAVDILPAVVPPRYRADLFIAIHADGSSDPNASGFRVASPRRDATGRASRFAALLNRSYGDVTNLRHLPSVTRRMRNYYAFNYRRYRHSLHPSTIGVIIETGFLTSLGDRRVILNDPERAARGIVEAIVAFPETSQGN